MSECDLLESKARGRHQSQAASLRISKIEKILSQRTDLTKQQRRKLQSRKNTANFRERQKNTNKLKHFINVELDAILNAVSPSPSYYVMVIAFRRLIQVFSNLMQPLKCIVNPLSCQFINFFRFLNENVGQNNSYLLSFLVKKPWHSKLSSTNAD